ncbi:phosphate ABC transporter ATP-binding protein [Gemmatimonadetes bacterium T265]|nr:phosphate ABC transporter ATP-binding protein [Gemmatimonadetes bacterium T265]
MPEGPPRFALRGVAQSRGGAAVLHDVTLAIPGGEVTALVGPSGAGKTSLLRLLNRLDDPTTGEVAHDGRPLASYPVRALRRRVGFVFQTPTMFAGTVADNLRAAAALGDPAGPAAPADLLDALDAAELPRAYADRDAARLSGGERQRVALARALVAAPAVLLLDEPTAALDPEVGERLMRTVARLPVDRGVDVVMVTHRLREARETSTYLVALEAGRVLEAGPSAALFDAAAHPRVRAYLASA